MLDATLGHCYHACMRLVAQIMILLLALQTAGIPAWASAEPAHTPEHATMHANNSIEHMITGMDQRPDCCKEHNEAMKNCLLDCLFGCTTLIGTVSQTSDTSWDKQIEPRTPLAYRSYISITSPPETPPPSV